jgi:hypothetical protein
MFSVIFPTLVLCSQPTVLATINMFQLVFFLKIAVRYFTVESRYNPPLTLSRKFPTFIKIVR